jgi:hypothetical protein
MHEVSSRAGFSCTDPVNNTFIFGLLYSPVIASAACLMKDCMTGARYDPRDMMQSGVDDLINT